VAEELSDITERHSIGPDCGCKFVVPTRSQLSSLIVVSRSLSFHFLKYLPQAGSFAESLFLIVLTVVFAHSLVWGPVWSLESSLLSAPAVHTNRVVLFSASAGPNGLKYGPVFRNVRGTSWPPRWYFVSFRIRER